MADITVRRRSLAVLKILAKAHSDNPSTIPLPVLTRKEIAQRLRSEYDEPYAHYQSIHRDQEPELVAAGLCTCVGKASHGRLYITSFGMQLIHDLGDELPDSMTIKIMLPTQDD